MILTGDCVEVMKGLAPESVDAIITDPPYELSFMGKSWDRSGVAFQVETWLEALRVLKPGGHLLAFGGTRTYHRLACAIEDAGFEIRDCLCWLYGSGFPKSLNVSKAISDAANGEPQGGAKPSSPNAGKYKGGRGMGAGPGQFMAEQGTGGASELHPDAQQWDGWGTALKPAFEPIVLARKPLTGTVAANVLLHGTGALNIDGCRVNPGERVPGGGNGQANHGGRFGAETNGARPLVQPHDLGRWPANVLLDEEAAALLDAQTGDLGISSGGNNAHIDVGGGTLNCWNKGGKSTGIDPGFGDSGGASRFFYCAKPDRAERDIGCEDLPVRSAGEATDREDDTDGLKSPRAGAGRTGGARNIHPTVKPVMLMRWLVRLVSRQDGIVLDPFMGSGTTGMACSHENRFFIGIERESEYVRIAERRIAAYAPLFAYHYAFGELTHGTTTSSDCSRTDSAEHDSRD